MRGAKTRSMHAYSIAVDSDSEKSHLKWRSDRARFAKLEFKAFSKIVESEGALSLGRAKNYNWMHFHFARV
ncbi:hypothetical protein ASG25_01965 [Rhizobium sp. Leaf384]|nr:hypothetical protein ASG58_17030 [Rhizobium sp. Leaf383]KQS80400.1 hypothetical protein ASG25_01965 [Rhizobium sp. Leaf384]